MQDELYYQLALTMIPDLGPVRCRLLIEHFGSASAVFTAKKKELSRIEGIGDFSAAAIKKWNAFDDAEKELVFIQQQQIRAFFITDTGYPKRLLHCYDPPTMIIYKGNADLNSSRILSIIGTRNHTAYGKEITEQVIRELSKEEIIIVSGLAFGIDSLAHKAALQNGMCTIGVLAHGLDTLYPPQNKTLAKEMLLQGGLLTEFRKNTKPDKHHFPKRNRIVAGMSDATIVIETASKGGSMITAELAYNYNRDLFAVPGKITDQKSSGCLQLIKQNKAVLLSDTVQLLETLGWVEKKKNIRKQKELFIELTAEEQTIVSLLTGKDAVPVDTIFLETGLSSSTIAAAILNLEIQNMITALPGKMYKLA
jgi:DNA processing protein